MSNRTTFVAALAVAIALLTATLAAQSRVAVPLLPDTAAFDGPVFADEDALAWVGGGKIHYLTGLATPATAVHHVLQPP